MMQRANNLYSQRLSLPEAVLERSVSNKGDSARMHNLFHKLRSGNVSGNADRPLALLEGLCS